MSIKKSIPNIITLLNLFSGCIAVYFACLNAIETAVFFTVLGIFFDFFDGFFARLFKANSDLGLQLDSLADMVTSGVVPGVVMFQMLKNSNLLVSDVANESTEWDILALTAFLGFAITLASCYRLANFNIDTRQTNSFIGLPTPANTLLILNLGLISIQKDMGVIGSLLNNTFVLLGIVVFSCFMLNAEIKLFALKFKDWSFTNNKLRYCFIIIASILVLSLTYKGLVLSILLYILLSFFQNKFSGN